MEDRTEEILFRVAEDPSIKEEDKPESIALLMGLSELGGRVKVERVIDYVELNRDRLIPIAKMLLEEYRKNGGNQENSSR